METTTTPESESMQMPVATDELYLHNHTESEDILGEGDGSTSPITPHMEQQLLPIETANFGLRTPSYHQEEVKGYNEIGNFPVYTPTKCLMIGSWPQTPVITPKMTPLTSPLLSPMTMPLTTPKTSPRPVYRVTQ